MKKFAIHYTGDYVRSNDGLSIYRDEPVVHEYDDVAQIPKNEQWAFEWMLEHGEVCISCGSTVYQVRKN